jgi:O-antigen ligase
MKVKQELINCTLPELKILCFFFCFTWAIGTNLLSNWYYPIQGIGLLDIVFIAWFSFAIINTRRRNILRYWATKIQIELFLLFLFCAWLLLSLIFNFFTFGTKLSDIFPILRLVYFGAIIVFLVIYVYQYNFQIPVLGFLFGITALVLERFADAQFNGAVEIMGFIVLKDPNVIGNMLSIGVFFSSLGILAGRKMISLLFAFFFIIASIFTFSKGTWIMVFLGIISNFVALLIYNKNNNKKNLQNYLLLILFLVGIGIVIYDNIDSLNELLQFKIESTQNVESFEERYRFSLAGLYAMIDYPIFGLGLNNFYLVQELYPSIIREQTDNAHNVFLQFAAVGGLLAFILLMLLFIMPFLQLSSYFKTKKPTTLGKIYLLLALVIFFLSGSTQLQLVYQPFFWVFTGLIFGMRKKERETNLMIHYCHKNKFK